MMQDLKNKNSGTVKKGPFVCKVLENIQVSPDIYKLRIQNKEIVESAQPGQFVSIKCGDLTLRRPFSVAKIYDDSFDLLYKVIGEGTQFLTRLKAGDDADFIGPMGNAFNIENKNSLLIGCGVGIAPIIYQSQKMESEKIEHTAVISTKTAVNYEFGEKFRIITEDGTAGLTGRLDAHLEDVINEVKPEKLYICGPNPAMIYATDMAIKYDLPIEVALEKVFACGTGVCMGCVIQVMKDGEQVNKRICRDGPVFNGREILWQ